MSSPLSVVPGMTRHDVPLSIMAGKYASFLSVEVNSSKSILPYLSRWKHENGKAVVNVRGGCVLETERDGDVIAGGDRWRDEHVAKDTALQS